MKYSIDHDYHIHSCLSPCSQDPAQNPNAILNYALQNGFKKICLTDHFWDDAIAGASEWYKPQNLAHIKKSLPLPQTDGVQFFFGAETDMDRFMTVGCSLKTLEELDFLIVSTTHLHMKGFTYSDQDNSLEGKINLWEKRLHALLDNDLPWHKIGLAHITTHLIENHIDTDHVTLYSKISEQTYGKAFSRCAEKGIGVELNFNSFSYDGERLKTILRPYFIAKDCGCKFYFGSDAHHPDKLSCAKANFENIVNLLDLTENDRFNFPL